MAVAVVFAGLLLLIPAAARGAGKAQHVVIVVMDGLRPDAVTEQTMPTLAGMAREGTVFANHHPVYPSMTEVNGAALATGMWPAHSGVIANREYRPDVELLGPVDTQGDWASWKGDQVRDGQWIKRPTLVEIVREKGLRAMAAGTKPVIMMWDRSRQERSVDQPLLYEGKSIPAVVLDRVIPQAGPIPPAANSKYRANGAQDHWTTRVLVEQVWKDKVPALTVLWLSEPDYAQHGSGPGSAVSKSAWKSSDECLARVRAALAERHLADQTDILVVSDHGFSTISRTVDIVDELKQVGFDADKEFTDEPKTGKVLVVGLGGSASFHVTGHDRKVLAKLMDFLQRSEWAGVIFTREGLEGTFKMSDAGIDAAGGPDVMVSMRWKDEPWLDRLPGTLVSDDTTKVKGQGMHGSLSRFDMHNTLIASGPDFKAGFVNELASGNCDVAPTVLNILGIAARTPPDGRVLHEAMVNGGNVEGKPQTTILEARREVDGKPWRQYLKITTVGNARYYDEGNAGGF
jgi:arylsulfatase A-like enzyme